MSRRQGIFWLLTIPQHDFVPYPIPCCSYLVGQLEKGSETGFLHWQLLVAFKKKCSSSFVRDVFGPTCHSELSRSDAANKYVTKEDTRVEGTGFEFGAKPFRRNSAVEWESVWTAAQSGNLEAIPANVRVVNYRTIRAIGSDFARPIGMERECFVFWGVTGSGKSRRAWDEASMEAYCKDPRTKFWDGYQVQEHVVIDEFRGGIDISHLLRWLDRYPVRVEIKGSSRPLLAKKIWITSNLDPKYWYPDIDAETLNALLRRLQITEFE
nr:MAG: replication associated protein [Cressdnaviricota sp.]